MLWISGQVTQRDPQISQIPQILLNRNGRKGQRIETGAIYVPNIF